MGIAVRNGRCILLLIFQFLSNLFATAPPLHAKYMGDQGGQYARLLSQ